MRLAKTIHADGRIDQYDKAKTIDLFEMPVVDLSAVEALLHRLLVQPSCAAVFGGVADPTRARGVRRLAYPDPDTGDLATLRAVAHQWCALDLDDVERPDAVPADDLAACAALAVQRLPVAFQGAQHIAQASASHGIKPGCRLRLWFWLSRPTTGDELGMWLKGWPTDPCTFRPAQPIYTAAPVFVGRSDHLPTRLVLIPGVDAVTVPSAEALKPPPRQSAPAQSDEPKATDADARAFIDEILGRVRTASDGQKHYALRSAARLLGGIQAKAGFCDAEAKDWLVQALPTSAVDQKRAEKTALWGLEKGRADPIPIPTGKREPDPRRKATARAAFRLIRMGVPGAELLATLHYLNERNDDPLPQHVIAETAVWVAQQAKEGAHAR